MSDRPTPETDALERCQRIHWSASPSDLRDLGDALCGMKRLARKLERERDEARDELLVAEKSEMEYAKVCDRLNAELKLWREGGVTEELLRKNDGYIRIGKGCAIVVANELEGGAQ